MTNTNSKFIMSNLIFFPDNFAITITVLFDLQIVHIGGNF